MRSAIEKRLDVDASGEIIHLETVCPWKDHLYELEEELKLDKLLKFCVFEVRHAHRLPHCMYCREVVPFLLQA